MRGFSVAGRTAALSGASLLCVLANGMLDSAAFAASRDEEPVSLDRLQKIPLTPLPPSNESPRPSAASRDDAARFVHRSVAPHDTTRGHTASEGQHRSTVAAQRSGHPVPPAAAHASAATKLAKSAPDASRSASRKPTAHAAASHESTHAKLANRAEVDSARAGSDQDASAASVAVHGSSGEVFGQSDPPLDQRPAGLQYVPMLMPMHPDVVPAPRRDATGVSAAPHSAATPAKAPAREDDAPAGRESAKAQDERLLASRVDPVEAGVEARAESAEPIRDAPSDLRGRQPQRDAFTLARLGPAPVAAGSLAPSDDEKLLLDLVNVERTSRNLKPLVWDAHLTRMARLHDSDMKASHRISHYSSRDSADLTTRLTRISYSAREAAENVAFDANVVKAHRALMQSPGHRRNILDPGLENVGLAIMTRQDRWIYVVEDFATPMEHFSDREAANRMSSAVARAKGWLRPPLAEDHDLSVRLDGLLEQMIASDTTEDAVGGGVGEGATIAFTSADPSMPPHDILAKASKSDGYALAVSFRKTERYPLGTWWAIVYLKDVY